MRLVLFLLASTMAIAGQFTTSIGDEYPYTVSALTTDATGNTYIVGTRTLPSTTDVFLSKLDPTGKLLFTDVFGGNASSHGYAVALDASGDIYIAGTTQATDFPLSKALQTEAGVGAAFIMKLSNDGTTILYSTYFGGVQGLTTIAALTTDAQGDLYLTGTTYASDFPHTAGMPNGTASQAGITQYSAAIIASISATGDKILYSGAVSGGTLTCQGGSGCFLMSRFTEGVAIGVDAAGNAYIAGGTNTTNLPITPGVLQATGFGAFVAKINAGGTGLGYLTYLSPGVLGPGGLIDGSTGIGGIAVDAAGDAYLTGATNDPAFPTSPGTYQPVFSNPSSAYIAPTQAFAAKLNPTGTAMIWATYVGLGEAQSVALDTSQNVWLTGTTQSPTFPNADGWTTGTDFLIAFNSTGSKLTYSALYPAGTVAQSVAVDPSGLVHVAGISGSVSVISPTSGPSAQIVTLQNAAGSPATARIAPGEVISIYGPGIGPATAVSAIPANGFYPTTLGGVQVSINGASISLLYVSQNQINAVAPMSLLTGSSAAIQVVGVTPPFPIEIIASAPWEFPGVLNQDGTLNSQSNPAKGGSIVTFYATGAQTNFYPFTDGQVATSAQNSCTAGCAVANSPNTTIVYEGPAPGIVAGVSQFNVQIPPTAVAAPFNFSFYPFGLNVPAVGVWTEH